MTDDPVFTDAQTMLVAGEPIRFGYPFPSDLAPGEVVVMKTREMIELHIDLLRRSTPRRVLELGIQRGGSIALLALLARPDVLIGVELADAGLPGLDDLLERNGFGDSTHLHFGVDQGDAPRLAEIVDRHTGGAPLDLVIDDASHLLEPTRASFDVAFPRLRPGGRMVIEDWGWEQLVSAAMVRSLRESDRSNRDAVIDSLAPLLRTGVDAATGTRLEAEFRSDPTDDTLVRLSRQRAHAVGSSPLTRLALELTLLVAERADIVAELHVDRHWVEIVRGPAELPVDTFHLADHVTDAEGVIDWPGTR